MKKYVMAGDYGYRSWRNAEPEIHRNPSVLHFQRVGINTDHAEIAELSRMLNKWTPPDRPQAVLRRTLNEHIAIK
jgi:hypothetical protein